VTDFDSNRLRVAAQKINILRDRILGDFKRRFPHDPWVVALAADELALAELKRSIMAKSRCEDFAECRAEVVK